MLDDNWKRWIAENKLLGAPDAEIHRVVAAALGSDSGVTQALADIAASPAYRAGQLLADQLKKLQSTTRILHQLQSLAPNAARIDRRHNLSATDFFIDYYAANRPVIVSGWIDHWPARRWTLEYLSTSCGELDVEIMWGRDGNADYETRSHDFKKREKFRDFVARLATADSDDFYLVANNGFFKQPGTHVLLADFAPLARIQQPADLAQTNFWLGPKGTVTPLHHDSSNILFKQIIGHKLFKFISPLQTPDVYNHLGVFSAVDPDAPDLARYPQFGRCAVIEETVGPGDVVFIPVGWWHHVRSLEASLSLSSTSFTQPNAYQWHYPAQR